MKNLLIGGQYRPLIDHQIEKIHTTSVKLLDQMGVGFEPELGSLLESIEIRGVSIDHDKGCIRFSEKVLMDMIAKAPDPIVLYSRDGRNDVDLGQDRVYFATGGTAVNILDLDTGQCRRSTIADIYQITRLVDRLENIDILTRVTTPDDLPLEISDVNLLYAALKGTGKHINLGIFVEENLSQVLDIATIVNDGEAIRAEKPWLSIHSTCMISPLKLDTKPVRIMEQAIEHGIPVSLSTAPMAGSTGPVTLAGTLTLMHAEQMAMIAISQLIKPGAPVIYCATPVAADMATMNFLAGTVESAMMMSAAHQLARHIGIPNFISGGWSDAKISDAQAGWESATTLLLAAMAGGNCVRHSAGVIDSAMTISMGQFVISNEILGIAHRLLKGIEISEDHIAYDVINTVGPGGEYITSDHTLKHMRSEFFSRAGVTNRQLRDQWEAMGSPDAQTAAVRKAKEILSEPETIYIKPETDRQIRRKYDIRLIQVDR